MKKLYQIFAVAAICCSLITQEAFSQPSQGKVAQSAKRTTFYDRSTQSKLKPYFLPLQHPMKPVLDQICEQGRILKNEESFEKAGFEILLKKRAGHTKHAFWHLARHPLVPGYLFKVYLDAETNLKRNEGWQKLANRCRGAANIRRLIQKKGIQHFVVPEKWLYKLPLGSDSRQQPVILMVTDMCLTGRSACRKAWKNATKEQLDELYCFYSHGYGSTSLVHNVCYTQEGKFAFIDTELPDRKVNMNSVFKYFSEEMQEYWENLIQAEESKSH